MTELLKRMCHKAHVLSNAFTTHQDAFLAHLEASRQWKASPSEDTAMMLHNTDCARDNARDTILTLAEGLLYATQAWIGTLAEHEMKALRRSTDALQKAVNAESLAFHAYSDSRVNDAETHAAFTAAQTEVISLAWPLVERIRAMSPCTLTGTGWHATQYFDQKEGLEAQGKPQTPPPPDPLAVKSEGQIDTDLDGTPAWQAGKTKAEQDLIIYQNRKATLGQKAAGRMIAQERARAKRNN